MVQSPLWSHQLKTEETHQNGCGQNSVFSWELWTNSNVQSWNLSPGWGKKPKRESQRGWVTTSTGKQLLGQNKEHLTGSLQLELGGKHLVTSPLKSQPLPFPLGPAELVSLFCRGRFSFSVLPFSPNSLFWSGKWKLERCSSQLWKCSWQCSITCICQSCSQQLKQRGSITFAMATTPCTLVKLHLTSFPLVILSWNVLPMVKKTATATLNSTCMDRNRRLSQPSHFDSANCLN